MPVFDVECLSFALLPKGNNIAEEHLFAPLVAEFAGGAIGDNDLAVAVFGLEVLPVYDAFVCDPVPKSGPRRDEGGPDDNWHVRYKVRLEELCIRGSDLELRAISHHGSSYLLVHQPA